MNAEQAKERLTTLIGQRMEEVRKDAEEHMYNFQIVKENGTWTSEDWKPKKVKIAVENAVLKEIIEDDRAIETEEYEGDGPPES